MSGTIIKIDRSKGLCEVYFYESTSTYQAEIGDFKNNADLKVGSECEIETLKEPSLFGLGKAKLLSVKAVEFKNEKVAVSYDNKISEHTIEKVNKDYLIAAEGRYELECRQALLEKAVECKVNGLLNVQLECVQRPGVKAVLFRYTATPAHIKGPKYNLGPNEHMEIPTKLARRNSPNEAMVRYVRVLLISALFILIPCVLSLTQSGVIPNQTLGQIINALLLVLVMFVFLFITYVKRRTFILVVKRKRS